MPGHRRCDRDRQPDGREYPPGGPVTDSLTITNVGNVEEDNITLADTLHRA